ncbi:MAG: hypothetical protein A3D39_00520 [Candidatus Buchananbacteria bacterium RIFCSPHIGHO2_02_FULL_39_17]|nr:MAG: hypothetical protein A3D39_00520 [Candidatus Buchananbacteria bacterium RIFCSPHIGHO2_02_FULL_39_17]
MNKNIRQELSDIVGDVHGWTTAALYSPLVMGLTGCSEQDQQYLLTAGIVGGVVLTGIGIAAYLVRGNNQEQQTYQNQTNLRATPRTEYRAEVYRPVETKATSRKTTNSRTEQKNRDRTSDNTSSSGYDFTPSYIDSGSSHDSGSHGSSGHSCGGGSHSCSSGSSSCSSGSSCGGGCGGGD